MREDTYIYDKFYFYPQSYKNKLSTLKINVNNGLNDHTLIVDRIYADKMFRYDFVFLLFLLSNIYIIAYNYLYFYDLSCNCDQYC